MDTGMGAVSIAAVCFFVVGIGFVKQKGEVFLNFLLRTVFGTIGIYAVNAVLLSQNIPLAVGINLLTVLTVGSLGASGFALLYGIAAFALL